MNTSPISIEKSYSGTLSGTILYGPDLEIKKGTLIIENGIIKTFKEGTINTNNIIMPCFVNAHIHVLDSAFKDSFFSRNLKKIVSPPDGLKHKGLQSLKKENKVFFYKKSLNEITSTGIGLFCDFFEGTIDDLKIIKALDYESLAKPCILGRRFPLDDLLAVADGFAPPSPRSMSAEHAEITKKKEKILASHVLEQPIEEQFGYSVSYGLDFAVHMNYGTKKHFEIFKEKNIGIVACPRSNGYFNLQLPDIKEMLNQNLTVALGTDNLFCNTPDMFREMEATFKFCNVDAKNVIKMATINGAILLNRDVVILPENKANLLILEENMFTAGSDQIYRKIVNRMSISNIKQMILSGF